MASILRPTALGPGDTVAVAALSSGLEDGEAAQLERGVQAIRAMGFNVVLSPLIEAGRHWWWSAERPKAIAEEFNRLVRDPAIRAIFALVGGRTTLSYLDLLDYEAVRRDPKPVVGFSDIDAVLLALHARTGLVGVHGDLIMEGFATRDKVSDERRKALAEIYLRLLTSVDAPGALPSSGAWECWQSGRAEGPLVGGLLNRLILLQATPFALSPDRFDGAILFWEELATSYAAVS